MNTSGNISGRPKAASQAAKISSVFLLKSETNRIRLRIIKKEVEIKKEGQRTTPPAQGNNK